jgi:hypothetical protein
MNAGGKQATKEPKLGSFEVLQKLRSGGGATLTEPECRALLELVEGRPRKSRKRSIIPEIRHDLIAILCALHCAETDGKLTKIVAGKIGDLFKVSRTQVFEIRNKHPINLEPMDSETLRALIASFEKDGLGWYTCKVVRQVRAQEFRCDIGVARLSRAGGIRGDFSS